MYCTSDFQLPALKIKLENLLLSFRAIARKLRFFFLGRHRPTQGSLYLTNFLQLQTHCLVGRKILSRKLLNYVFIDLGMYYVYAQNMYLCRYILCIYIIYISHIQKLRVIFEQFLIHFGTIVIEYIHIPQLFCEYF